MPVTNDDDRKRTLLLAAYYLIKECNETGMSTTEALVKYDGTECDSQCLIEDIALELGIEE